MAAPDTDPSLPRPGRAEEPRDCGFLRQSIAGPKANPAFRDGNWSQIQPQQAWSGNWTSEDFVAYAWAGDDGSRYLVVVNYAGNQGQCRLALLFPEYRGKKVRLTDMMGTESTTAMAARSSISVSTSITHPGSIMCSSCARSDGAARPDPMAFSVEVRGRRSTFY